MSRVCAGVAPSIDQATAHARFVSSRYFLIMPANGTQPVLDFERRQWRPAQVTSPLGWDAALQRRVLLQDPTPLLFNNSWMAYW